MARNSAETPTADVAQRAVFVVGVVEEAGIASANGGGHLGADHDAAVAEAHRLGRQLPARRAAGPRGNQPAVMLGRRAARRIESEAMTRRPESIMLARSLQVLLPPRAWRRVALRRRVWPSSAADDRHADRAPCRCRRARGLASRSRSGQVRDRRLVERPTRSSRSCVTRPTTTRWRACRSRSSRRTNDVRVRAAAARGRHRSRAADRRHAEGAAGGAAALVRIVEGQLDASGAERLDHRRRAARPIDAVDLAGTVRLETGIGTSRRSACGCRRTGCCACARSTATSSLALAARPADARILALALNGTIASDIPLTMKDTWGPRWGEATLGKGRAGDLDRCGHRRIEIKAP